MIIFLIKYAKTLITDIELVKVSYLKIRDERKKKDYNYDYFENVQAITFPEYPIIMKDKEGEGIALLEMEWGVLPTYIQDPKLQNERRRRMVNACSS